MARSPIALAATVAVFLILPPLLEGQSSFGQGLFSRDPNAAIVRKAKKYNLVSVKDAVPGAYIDMRYKITSASGKPLYREEMPCLVHRSTAEKLKRVNKKLKEHGYALKIWDAWRPPEAHIALWNAVKDPNFVVPPSKGLSWHCYGISVDLTLVQLDGTAVAMPSAFDEFSDRAASDYTGGDPAIAKRVDLIQRLMIEQGFRKIQSEWWHFDDMKAQGGIRRVTAADLGIRMP
jgi:D-alanyl-D-alanine dipeptidase